MRQAPKVLVIGSEGMLGSDYIRSQSERWNLIASGRRDLDITNLREVMKKVDEIHPDYVLNCAAYTKVDDAEDVGSKMNYEINALGVYHLAKACKKNDCGFITISTDYVFDGTKKGGYDPGDEPNPINAYGMAKYLGERLALEEYERTIVVRTSWLYGGGPEAKNFVNTILRLGRSRSELRIIADQFGSPTNTLDLCKEISRILSSYSDNIGRIHHFCNGTEDPSGISWYDFAKEILRMAKIDTPLTPIFTEEYSTKAKRPKNSKLNIEKNLPYWEASLEKHIKFI